MNTIQFNSKKHTITYHYYTTIVSTILCLGLSATAYLTYSHYKNYTDIYYSSFCAISKSINCDTVSQSHWSVLFSIPLSIWVFFAYILFFIIFIPTLKIRKNSADLWIFLCLLSFIYTIVSIYFGYISVIKIKAYCPLCVAIYLINFSLFLCCCFVRQRFCKATTFGADFTSGLHVILRSRQITCCILILMAMLFLIKFYIPPYWQYTFPSPSHPAVSSGITEEGNPWLGSATPEITIHEYTDYLCFQCRKMHYFLRKIIIDHPEKKIRIVHHHYPMDHEFNNIVVPEPFHIGSGKMAMISIYAASKGKFWEMNDALYLIGQNKQTFNTRTLGEETGFSSGELTEASQHPQIREELINDIRRGMKLGIIGTPTFVINDNVYQGSIPTDILKKIDQQIINHIK